MYKSLILVLFGFLIQPVMAAPILNFTGPGGSTNSAVPAPIAPATFDSQVKTVNSQNKAQFKQTLDQRKSSLANPSIPTLSEVQKMSKTTPPPATSDTSSEPESTVAPIPSVKEEAPIILPQTNEQPLQPTTPAIAPAPPKPAPPQSQPYTGFPSQGGSSGSTGTQKNDGFNIKY